jgi:hypothetical protein
MSLLQSDTCHPGRSLCLMMLFGPSALNDHSTSIMVFITGLRRRGRSWPPFPSSCHVVKQSLIHELVNAKLILLSDAEGALGKIRAMVGARGGARGFQCHASGLHPQQ